MKAESARIPAPPLFLLFPRFVSRSRAESRSIRRLSWRSSPTFTCTRSTRSSTGWVGPRSTPPGPRSLGIHHIAVTDHGVMYGAMEWYKTATSAGLHPISAWRPIWPKAAPGQGAKVVSLVAPRGERTGYRNLLKLSTRAQLEGYYYRPRIDLEMLRARERADRHVRLSRRSGGQ